MPTSLDLRPGEVARRPIPTGRRRRDGAPGADGRRPSRRRRPTTPLEPPTPAAAADEAAPATAHDPRDRRPDALPGDVRRPARREHPGPDPGAGPGRRSASTTCATWGLGRHRSVDDAPYGGGAGMILRPEPVAAALDALRRPDSTVDPARPGRRGLPPGPGRGPRRRDRISSSSARATRASTSGSARWSTSSCRSATTS